MAFIIISSKGVEVGRRGLAGGITVGRAPDCELSVHDILLSRHHCRIEPSGRGWVVLDLHSKNGTWLDEERVGRRSLRHGEVVRAGNTTLRFMTGELAADAEQPRLPRSRPADPLAALAGTVVDFDARHAEDSPEDSRLRATSRMPYPKPMPREPASYARDGIYFLLEEIASSSWDSIYANASRPTRPAPQTSSITSATAGKVNGSARIARSVLRPAAPSAGSTRSPQAGSTRSPQAGSTRSPRAGSPRTVPAARLRTTSAGSTSSPQAGSPQGGAAPPPLNGPAMATPPSSPVRSRLQVDFSLQAPAMGARVIPTAYPTFAAVLESPAPRRQRRKPTFKWMLCVVPRTLAAARRRLSPRGAIILL